MKKRKILRHSLHVINIISLGILLYGFTKTDNPIYAVVMIPLLCLGLYDSWKGIKKNV